MNAQKAETKENGDMTVKGITIKRIPLSNAVVRKADVVLRKTDEGYSVHCPGLPGCWSQGATKEEAIENIKDAIELYLEAVSKSTNDTPVPEIEVAV